MKTTNTKLVWGLIIATFLLIMFGAFAKLESWSISRALLLSGMLIFAVAWIIILYDIIITEVKNKTVWILSMVLLPFIAAVVYLVQREKKA